MGADAHAGEPDGHVLARFGIDESALLGRGGEARVFALDGDRVLRLLHRHVDPHLLDARRALLQAIGGGAGIPVPEVLEHVEVDGRIVIIERRLPGRNAMEVLADPATDRTALIRDHLDTTARIADLPCPTSCFGEIWGDFAIAAPSFHEWATSRLTSSLAIAGPDFAHLDPVDLTEQLVAALPAPASTVPQLVHLDAFLGNMLAEDDRITAVLDFGPMTIGGPAWLDPLVSIAYLATEITPTAIDEDRAVAREWAAEHDLVDALAPAERWMACYWTAAPDDEHLQRWCTRILRTGR